MLVLEKDSVIVSISFEELQIIIKSLKESSKTEQGYNLDRVRALEGSFAVLLRDLREKLDN